MSSCNSRAAGGPSRARLGTCQAVVFLFSPLLYIAKNHSKCEESTDYSYSSVIKGLSQDFLNACPKQQFQNFCPSRISYTATSNPYTKYI